MSGQVYANSIFSTKKASPAISAGTLARQQQQSNQYGIPTYSTTGTLDTIPTDLKFSNIFEGFGQYGDAASFKQAVVDKVSQNPSAYNVTIQQNPNGGSPTITIPDPTQPQRTFNVNDPKTPLVETTGQSQTLNQISTFIKNNKTLVLGAGALLLLLVLFGGKGRR